MFSAIATEIPWHILEDFVFSCIDGLCYFFAG